MGKTSRRVKEAAVPPPTSPSKPADTPPNNPSTATEAPPKKPLTLTERFLPEGGLLPWWVVLVFSVYALLQIGLTLEHPCAVLGVHTGMKRAQVLKSYRSLSMCTHPDKLVGHEAEDVRRGSMLFKRASSARDQLLTQLRESAAAAAAADAEAGTAPADDEGPPAYASCSTQLDTVIYETLYYLLGSAMETGALAMVYSIASFLYDLVTFQYDISMTISMVLLLITLVRTLQSLLGYIISEGPLTTILAACTTVIVGPLPTIYRALVLPALRIVSFTRHELLPYLGGKEDSTTEDASASGGMTEMVVEELGAAGAPGAEADLHLDESGHFVRADGVTAEDKADVAWLLQQKAKGGGNGGGGGGGGNGSGGGAARPPASEMGDDDEQEGGASSSSAAAAGGSQTSPSKEALPRKGLRQRKAPLTKQEIDEQREALLRGDKPMQQGDGAPIQGQPQFPPMIALSTLPLTEVIGRKPLPHARPQAAAAMQFDLIFSTTKYVIPLFMLISTGQVRVCTQHPDCTSNSPAQPTHALTSPSLSLRSHDRCSTACGPR